MASHCAYKGHATPVASHQPGVKPGKGDSQGSSWERRRLREDAAPTGRGRQPEGQTGDRRLMSQALSRRRASLTDE